MLCEMCHKREATVHIKEISGGQTKVWHLCEECAAKQAVGETGVNPVLTRNCEPLWR
jgi:protein-arginine kinase activator protein McsA